MASYRTTVASSWSVDRTFDYLVDFRSVAEWDPSMTSATLVSGTAGTVGAVYELEMSTLGTTSTLRYEATKVERPHRFVVRYEGDGVTSEDTITVREADGGVEVTYDAELDLKGVRKVAAPAAEVGLVLSGERAKRSLQDKLASAS